MREEMARSTNRRPIRRPSSVELTFVDRDIHPVQSPPKDLDSAYLSGAVARAYETFGADVCQGRPANPPFTTTASGMRADATGRRRSARWRPRADAAAASRPTGSGRSARWFRCPEAGWRSEPGNSAWRRDAVNDWQIDASGREHHAESCGIVVPKDIPNLPRTRSTHAPPARGFPPSHYFAAVEASRSGRRNTGPSTRRSRATTWRSVCIPRASRRSSDPVAHGLGTDDTQEDHLRYQHGSERCQPDHRKGCLSVSPMKVAMIGTGLPTGLDRPRMDKQWRAHAGDAAPDDVRLRNICASIPGLHAADGRTGDARYHQVLDLDRLDKADVLRLPASEPRRSDGRAELLDD